MNRELRNLFDENNIITKKITLINNVRIVETENEKLVIKKRNSDLEEIFNYLKSRSFEYIPEIIYRTENYDIYKYINDTYLEKEEKMFDIIKIVTLLHSKTTFYKEIDDDTYKELYEKITERIDYLYNYYNDIADIIENYDYMSPSNYLFIRNISKLFASLDYSKYQLNNWYNIIEEKKRIRVVNIHNNLSLEHYLLEDRPYLISWDSSKRDLPIYDLITLYKKYYKELDFCDLFRIYESNYPLLNEEKNLLFCLLTVPDKLDFNDTEFNCCKKVKKFYEYLFATERLINDYLPHEQEQPS